MKALAALLLVIWSWSLPALAADGPDEQAERAQILQRRGEVEAEYTQRAEQCRREFVVTPCLEKARIWRQDGLRTLREREIQLDEAERRRRAQRQAERVAQKQQARAEEAGRAASAASAPAAAASRPGKAPASPHEAKPAPADRSGQERQSRERFEARQREIQAHREAVEKRNAQRKGKAPKPLPEPGAGSASAF